jgi:hypothetical protein
VAPSSRADQLQLLGRCLIDLSVNGARITSLGVPIIIC